MLLPRRLRTGVVAAATVIALAQSAMAGRAPSLPADIPSATRQRLAPVTEDASVATLVDAEPFVARRDVFEYLLDHPEFATHVTQALRLARYRIWPVPSGLAIDDGWGTVGTFELVHAAPGVRVMYARGEYHPRVLPNIRGHAVVTIDYTTAAGQDGKTMIHTTVGGFVKLDSALLALAGRLAGAAAEAKAEKEAKRLVKVFARTTRAIADNPALVYETLRQRPETPRRELEEFRRLLSLPAAAARR